LSPRLESRKDLSLNREEIITTLIKDMHNEQGLEPLLGNKKNSAKSSLDRHIELNLYPEDVNGKKVH
jgi:hypothetical protein